MVVKSTDSRLDHAGLCLSFLLCVSVFESLKWSLFYRMDITIVPIPGEVVVAGEAFRRVPVHSKHQISAKCYYRATSNNPFTHRHTSEVR